MNTSDTITVLDDLSILVCEPAEHYHAMARDYLSSHQLADFRRCPLLYYRKKQGLIPDEDRPAYLVGRATHTLVLEGDQAFEKQYTVGGPVNPRTGAPYGPNTKAFADWAATHGKAVLTDAQFELVTRMAESVRTHAAASELLAEGIAERVVRTVYCGVPCQVRMDWFDPHGGIVDLKTTDNLDYFEADARRYGYAHQMSFYGSVLEQCVGIPMPCHLLAVEKREPYRTGLWKLTDDVLSCARQENEAAIARLRRCEETDVWETGYETVRFFDSI